MTAPMPVYTTPITSCGYAYAPSSLALSLFLREADNFFRAFQRSQIAVRKFFPEILHDYCVLRMLSG